MTPGIQAPTAAGQAREADAFRAAGMALAHRLPHHGDRARGAAKAPSSYVRRILETPMSSDTRNSMIDNLHLLRTAQKEVRDFVALQRGLPRVCDHDAHQCTRIAAVARAYMDQAQNRFDDATCTAFLDGFQEVAALELAEVWGMKGALQREMLERLVAEPGLGFRVLDSLRLLSDLPWKDLVEAVNRIDGVLSQDPVGAYTSMDFDSRDRYRAMVAQLSRHSQAGEMEVAEAVLTLARGAHSISDGSRASARRAHVGYYLLDKGVDTLKEVIGYRPLLRERLISPIKRSPQAYYLISIELLTCLFAAAMLAGVDRLTPFFAALLLLLLPASQAAVTIVNNLTTTLFGARTLPRLDFSKGVAEDCSTMVVVPTLLLNQAQVRDQAMDLEIRYLANRDPHVYFALLTDCPDSNRQFDERDPLVDICIELIDGLNRRYPGSPFFLFHRYRVYNEREGHWMGWERKRGKLLDFNRLLRGGFDSFPVKTGNLAILPEIRYVITLDSDTTLPRDSARKLIGAIAHPLNAAVVDPVNRIVTEGYGILQPRVGISIQSATRSRLAALYSGETGFDIYTRAVSDVYQDLFGEGIFTGKGIYEVDVLRDVLEQRFPENSLLSHDLIEGAYARAALVSDIELIDDYPSHFSAYSRRKHRWVRGDWQILRWLLERVPDRALRMAPNPISVISRWKIVDNLRRSLMELSLVTLFLGGWFWLPGHPVYWTLAAAALVFLPAYSSNLFSLAHIPRDSRAVRPWVSATVRTFRDGNTSSCFSLVFLLHQALISVDAIFRSILRVFITRRKLLQWETAAEAEAATPSRATVDIYLEWTPILAIVLAVLVWVMRRDAFSSAAPILFLWAISLPLSAWLNRPPRTSNRALRHQDVQWLTDYGQRMCRFFREWSTPATNWLIPDQVQEDGAADGRLSPTNLGMLLNARVAALHFGAITLAEFAMETTETLQRVQSMYKHRGHLLNWYNIDTLQPCEPRFVSTVDSGNLAASLWTLKQAALAFAAEPSAKRSLTPEIREQLGQIAAISDRLVRDMDFRFLYEPRRKLLSIGYDAAAGTRAQSYYDLLASEARMATFVAIAKGDIPQEAWFHLGRGHKLYEGEVVLLSWTGTMFEYFMPALWMRHYAGTITENSIRSSLRAQFEYARQRGIPWGISESACITPDGSHGYGPFGIPELALKRFESENLVVSPYSSFLGATVDPAAALKNLKQLEHFGWSGRYGFFEAIDYTRSGGKPIRAWMAHHQGMSLLAVCNLLYDSPMQRYFHAEPYVLATELLLHERMPIGIQPESEEPIGMLSPQTA